MLGEVRTTRVSISIVAYDERWPQLFAREAERLRPALGAALVGLHHIGSTAVHGLPAKPIIDMSVIITSLFAAPAIIPRLEALGYTYIPAYEALFPQRRYLERIVNGEHTHHLHLLPPHTAFLRRHLAFRDTLRHNAALRAQYAALKHDLAAQHAHDRAAYTAAKTAFIEDILAHAT